jgi:uncharacterized membrane protein YtjA (UPF0391 family)
MAHPLLLHPWVRAFARHIPHQKDGTMLHWALTFFVIALIAAVLGFRGVAGLSAEMGYVFVVVAIIFLAIGLLTGRAPVGP